MTNFGERFMGGLLVLALAAGMVAIVLGLVTLLEWWVLLVPFGVAVGVLVAYGLGYLLEQTDWL